jgi:electron transfer flavoprotein alpha subunit
MAVTNIWVFANGAEGVPDSATLELLTKARALVGDAGGSVTAFVGGPVDDLASTLGEYGATKVYDTAELEGRLPGVAVAAAMKAVIDGGDAPDVVMFPQSYEGRDVMSRLSVKLDRSVLTNNTEIAIDGDSVRVTTPIFGGTKLVTTTFTGAPPFLVAFRPKSFAAEPAGGGAPEVVTVPVPDLGPAGAAKVEAVHVEEHTGPKLDEANVVVSGGRGLGEAAKYEMIETLAKALKGAPGASRAIVDAGWVPYSYQVGQTGKVVKPTVYIAAGISGATQHMVGMKGSKNIIAINKDKEAPIFGIADLGIVGDVHKVLPKLIEALQNR